MGKRPLSVTIIAWFLIITSLFGLFSSLTVMNNPVAAEMLARSPLSPTVHQLIGIVGAAITLVCGYGILKGHNWARVTYLAAAAAGLAVNLLTVPMVSVIVLGLLVLGVIAFLLYRPAANAWFGGKAAAEG